MTPKEKAKELVWKYLPILEGWKHKDSNQAKKCALILVDEILKSFGTLTNGNVFYTTFNAIEYYKEVKQEIINL
jgi:hypothetical protein